MKNPKVTTQQSDGIEFKELGDGRAQVAITRDGVTVLLTGKIKGAAEKRAEEKAALRKAAGIEG